MKNVRKKRRKYVIKKTCNRETETCMRQSRYIYTVPGEARTPGAVVATHAQQVWPGTADTPVAEPGGRGMSGCLILVDTYGLWWLTIGKSVAVWVIVVDDGSSWMTKVGG